MKGQVFFLRAAVRRGRVYGLVGGNDSGKSQGLRLGVSAGSVSEISFHD